MEDRRRGVVDVVEVTGKAVRWSRGGRTSYNRIFFDRYDSQSNFKYVPCRVELLCWITVRKWLTGVPHPEFTLPSTSASEHNV